MYLPVGTYLQGGRYEILRYISSGGFGCTYEARDTNFKSKVKTVAIKEFFVKDFCNRDTVSNSIVVATLGKKELVERLRNKFIEEAEALYDLQHPNIVRVTDKFEENNTAYYVMDYIDGKPLSALVDEKGRLSESETLGYINQVADALGYVHSHNRLHLDVKPQNIMIDHEGKAVLIDFGVSKQYDEVNGENTSTLLGSTPGYAPIEQSGNGVVRFYPSADIYALGATLYKALTGVTPVAAHLRASGEELDPMPADISPATCAAVEAAMKINKAHRPQSIAEFLALLKANSDELIDDADVEVTAMPDNREQSGTIGESSEETRAVEKKIEQPAVKAKEPYTQKKNRTQLLVAVLVLLGILIGAGCYFPLPGSNNSNGGSSSDDGRTSHGEEPASTVTIVGEPEPTIEPPAPVVNTDSIVAARLQAYQDSIAEAQRQREEQERIAREAEINAFKNRTFTANGVLFKMVAVGGGTFQMGATSEQQDAYYDEKLIHSVTLSGYYIGETEVTQELWQAVMGSNPSRFTGNSQRPVECVSWNDCQTFVNKLNDLLAGQLPAGRRFRLPTEAEWEYAARGGNRSRGTQYSGSNSIDNVAWYWDNSGNTPHPVKGKSRNELGLYDMSGNVWEWCSDWYGSNYYSSSPSTNPQGPSSGSCRVLRGGSWGGGAQGCRVAGRGGGSPGNGYYYGGLRLAL